MPHSQEEIHKICAYLQSDAKCFESMGTSTNNSKTAQSMAAKRWIKVFWFWRGSYKIKVESRCQTELST